ncbi:MAG: SRPBCC family protein [Terracidiphilus sp.]
MSDFRQVVEIQASPARVWSVLLDVEHWPEWTTSVTKVHRMDIGPLTLGSRTRVWQPKLAPAVWCVTSLDQKRRIFAWTTRNLGVKIVARHQVDAIGNFSRVTLSLHYSGVLGAILARIYRDLNRDYLSREAGGLRAYCEAPMVQQRAAAR